MAVKIIVIVVFLLILFNLGSALFYMMKDGGQGGDRMARSLTWRIGLSVAAFMLLMIAFWLGWIEPQGITPTAPQIPGG